MKHIQHIILWFIATVLILGILWFSNGFFGNPLSQHLAKTSAEQYMTETYAHTDFILRDVQYDFKTGRYYAEVYSPSSVDSYFSFDISLLGEVQHDYYQSNVLDGYNTMMRCNEGYSELVDEVFSAIDFPYESEMKYGSFRSQSEQFEELMKSLKIDQDFDYDKLGKEFGRLTFYVQDEEITLEKASEILLDLKQIFDKAEVSFHQVYFLLEEPYINGSRNFEGETLTIYNFLYDDIYEEGMLERVTKAYEETNAYVE